MTKMAEYRLTSSLSGSVVRVSDGASIPPDPANHDWRDYQAWLALGHTPDPAPSSIEPARVDAKR